MKRHWQVLGCAVAELEALMRCVEEVGGLVAAVPASSCSVCGEAGAPPSPRTSGPTEAEEVALAHLAHLAEAAAMCAPQGDKARALREAIAGARTLVAGHAWGAGWAQLRYAAGGTRYRPEVHLVFHPELGAEVVDRVARWLYDLVKDYQAGSEGVASLSPRRIRTFLFSSQRQQVLDALRGPPELHRSAWGSSTAPVTPAMRTALRAIHERQRLVCEGEPVSLTQLQALYRRGLVEPVWAGQRPERYLSLRGCVLTDTGRSRLQ